jgi:hypothetical protein
MQACMPALSAKICPDNYRDGQQNFNYLHTVMQNIAGMITPLDSNPIFDLAANLVNQTNRHIFLTGKAGTGKTTFLKYIKEHSPKKSVIVAPTGIAAINCGGVTIHSFFQLPFGPFIPVPQRVDNDSAELSDAYTLLQNLRIHNEKRELFEEIELLIIDEISMVRCDVLDAIDVVLRHVRKKRGIPFGGVQMIYIGDLFQLPPVVQEHEWSILRNFYRTPFFFHAKVIEQIPPLIIELQKIYRQQDPLFIDLLNRVRNNITSQEDLELLNSCHNKSLIPNETEAVITLTSHNYLADRINTEELAKLPGEPSLFDGTVDGDFPAKSYPTEKQLVLKEGVQIMFIKNDMKQKERRYYNGKLGRISCIDGEKVYVEFPGESEHLVLEREVWRNVRYVYNPKEQLVEEQELGQFSQFPIRLAWAITIHKSQGLTFQKIVIDAANSFSAGQVYVALSRCTSLQGIALKSSITNKSIQTDERILSFMQQSTSVQELQRIYQDEKHQYLYSILIKAFEWNAVSNQIDAIMHVFDKRNIPHKEEAVALMQTIYTWIEENKKVSRIFQRHLYAWMKEASDQEDYTHVHQRVDDASKYFSTKMNEEVIGPLERHIDATRKMKKVRKYLKDVQLLLRILLLQQKSMVQSKELLLVSNPQQPISR